ncbi:thiol reductase thioredoxin [candidate division WWE3 bacterium CG10_big_fil_rev_8_21_14_0_10_32_10]|uniref:Thiol reductase thioredoxin n=1 Tax=candidate division WWE3 bacterium CG10_big_fil_rev_8_21_14_0_10_32_10 TaxID=1975090 RepID=A0A2H0RA20_UNCKA|nr:MAG: thiol reductase thioredoxin [candidate division WWE3 bacterium CG10_big_fil_rev_8_21_14_0_10_32_10]
MKIMKKLIDFYADWCGPCIAMKPTVEKVLVDYKGKVDFSEINVDSNQSEAQKYGIMSIPTFVILDENDKEIDRKMGAMAETQFKNWLDSHLS